MYQLELKQPLKEFSSVRARSSDGAGPIKSCLDAAGWYKRRQVSKNTAKLTGTRVTVTVPKKFEYRLK